MKAKPISLEDLPDIFGVSEYCRYFGISRSQFFVWRRHGVLPVRPVKLPGRVLRFRKSDVEAWQKRKAS